MTVPDWSGREDSNLRPPRPERGALPGCATPRIRLRRVYQRDYGLASLQKAVPVIIRGLLRGSGISSAATRPMVKSCQQCVNLAFLIARVAQRIEPGRPKPCGRGFESLRGR
jgi:hypothetical protein